MPYGLKAGLWVRATLRRFNQNGQPALIIKKGDEDAGAIFILLTDTNGQAAILQEYGNSWRRHELKADTPFELAENMEIFFDRQKRFDPDLWIIEITVKDVASPLETLLETRKISD
ncbi:DUF1491 family protein [Acetobacteraceae bacterium ESL0709]|nr:DUF1491 family protein [Acetobacteraceae bacterium ESL0697]MDF7677464.1 DUF1491 family protein [Acetobacteraceae bacterium ESL0709]